MKSNPKGEYKMNENKTTNGIRTGISFGSALAIAVSYAANHSIGWAILHGMCSWFYILYYIIKY